MQYNQWYFIALKWQYTDGTLNCTLYVNNDETYTGSIEDFKDFTGGTTALGSSIFGKYFFNGYIKDFSYSSNELSENDIISLYNKTLEDDTGTTITNSYAYEDDRIKTITHNGFSYSFGYDSFGNNETVAVAGQNLITNYYNPITGNLEEYQYGNGQKMSLDYDDLNRVIARNFKDTTDPNFNTRYTYQYDNAGNLGYHEDKVNNKNYRYIYDLADRLVKVTDSEGNYTTFGYDKNNNQSKLVHKIDNNSYETFYSYDKDNKPDRVYYGEGVANNINVEYFPLNGTTVGSEGTVPVTETPVFQKDENGETVLAAYSGTKVVYNLGISKASGTMTAWFTTEGSGSRLILSNEVFSQLLNVYVDTNQKVNVAVINNAGVFTNVITTVETITPKEWNFIALKWQLDGSTLTLTLYLNNKKYTANTTDFKDFTGAQTAVGSNPYGNYTLNGLIKNFSYSPLDLSDNEMLAMYYNSRVNYEYDTLGRLTKKTITAGANSYETSYSYVPGNVTGATTSKLSSISNNGVPIEYQYDANGNITKIIEDGMENRYYYNELNELIEEDNKTLDKSIVYSYDLGGNIIGKIEMAYGTEEPETIITYGYDDTWKDKLTSYNGKPITYDQIGNPLTYDGYIYTWEEGRKLKSITGNEKSLSFKYNDQGIRTEKTVDGAITKYYLLGDKVTLEDNGTDKLYYSYDSFNNLISMNLNGEEYYYIRNGQGDIIGLFDSNGTEVVRYYYDSWGKLISIEGTLKDIVGVKNPYRYRGYRYDTETGLYYLQSRYYNPEWGRFINGDAAMGSIGEVLSHNLFIYCINNPVNMLDESGDWPSWLKSITDTFRSVVTTIAKAVKSVVNTVAKSASSFVYSKMKDLGKGWSYRRDKGGSHTREKEHVHVQGGGKKYQQDVEGGRRTLENPPGLPHPPAKVRQRLKEKEGWDWDENAAKPTASKVITVVGFGGGVYLVYRAVRMIPSLAPPLWWTIPGNLAVP